MSAGDSLARSEASLEAGGAESARLLGRRQLKVLVAGRGLLGRFTYLVATQVVTVLVGLAYWTVSARLVPSAQVGVAAAGMSAALFLGMLGVLGITSLLLVVLGSVAEEEERPLVVTCLLVASAAVGLLAIGAWALSPLLGPSLRALGSNPLDGVLFVLGAIASTCGSVLDAAAIGLRRGPVQLARNAVASALKVAFVLAWVVVERPTATGLLVAWDVSIGISLLVALRLLHLRGRRLGHVGLVERLALVRRFASLSIGHHLLNLAIGSITYFLPVVAALFVLPSEMAYFSIAQLVSGGVLLLPFLLAISLFVESTGDDAALRRNVRKTFPVGLACCACLLAVFEPGGRLVLSVFGRDYASHGIEPLRLLLLGGLPYVVKDHFMAIRRAQNRLGEAARIGVLATTLEVLGAALGGWLAGLVGLCAAWALATFVEGGLFLPAVVRVLRSGPDGSSKDGSGPGDGPAAALEYGEAPKGYALP